MKTVPAWIILLVAIAAINPTVKAFIDWAIWRPALVTALTDGASLTGTTLTSLMSVPFSVVCGITIENWSVWPMSDPVTYNNVGDISVPARPVLPGQREAMVTHKTAISATGTYGSVSWLLDTPGGVRRVVVMWSVPYTRYLHSNYLAVGITKPGRTHHSKSFADLMYYYSSNNDIGFVRKEYYHSSSIISYEDDLLIISGTTGTSSKPEIRITVQPKDEKYLAKEIKKMYDKQRKQRTVIVET